MFHVGGARSALFNWMYVKRFDGVFILRIEDTDAERNQEEWVQGIYDALKWIGIDWDELYRQTDNTALHVAAGQKLYETGNAYYCDCTREIVDARTKGNATPGYDKFCRDRGLQPGPGRALRFRVPEGSTTVIDWVRGEPTFDNANIEDFAVVRGNGAPLYVLANVVDDLDQRVTHVVRGEEHLPNTPKQLLIWDALGGGERPVYAHLPVIVNDKRQKLSKRRDKVSLEMYRDEGYLPEAMRNYLALLGWAPKGDREILPIDDLVAEFDLHDIIKSSAFFDIQKLNAFNGEYIRALSVDEFIERCRPFVGNKADDEIFRAMARLVQERVSRLDEVLTMVDFFYVDMPELDEASMKVTENEASLKVLARVTVDLVDADWTAQSLHHLVQTAGEANALKLGKAQAPIRLAVTGRKVGPPLFESMELLGRDRTIARLRRLQEVVESRG